MTTDDNVINWRELTLSTIYAAVSGEQIVTNDRGNGAGGPGFMQGAFSVDMSEVVAEVTEDEDEDAWQLARDAFRLLGFDGEPFRVFVGERSTKDGSFDPSGHQMIYAI